MQSRILILASSLLHVYAIWYDAYTGKEITTEQATALQKTALFPWCAVDVEPCQANETRRVDYSCNNFKMPSRGAQFTPYVRMLPMSFSANYNHRVSTNGNPLPPARRLRVKVMSDGRQPSKIYTQMVTSYLAMVTGDVTSVHDTFNYIFITTTCCTEAGRSDPRCMPVYVDNDDPFLRRSQVRCMNLTRVLTYQNIGCRPINTPPNRINTVPPMLELSGVYGHDTPNAHRGRLYTGGRMKSEVLAGREWPPAQTGGQPICLNNRLPSETRCHDSPSPVAANALLGANVVGMWFFRAHNDLARRLEQLNPCWSDDRLFQVARDINIAYSQHVMFYELMPTLLGWNYLEKRHIVFKTLDHVDDYDDTLEPTVSIEYVTGSRWFHTMQEGRLKMYDKTGKLYREEAIVDYSLHTGALPINNTLGGITEGFIRGPAGAADHLVDPDVSERIAGRFQLASDVVSSDIMKGRDNGLPPYNRYREHCGLKPARTFDDLRKWMPDEQVEAMEQTYEDVEDIDIMVGILSEDAMRGAAIGPTLACFIADQMLRWRRADRFWYENSIHPGAFTREQLYEIRKITTARLACSYADDVETVQRNIFLLPEHRNKRVPCSQIPTPSLEPWKDETCARVESNQTTESPETFTDTNLTKH